MHTNWARFHTEKLAHSRACYWRLNQSTASAATGWRTADRLDENANGPDADAAAGGQASTLAVLKTEPGSHTPGELAAEQAPDEHEMERSMMPDCGSADEPHGEHRMRCSVGGEVVVVVAGVAAAVGVMVVSVSDAAVVAVL